MTDVNCTFSATAVTPQSPTGTVKLMDCNPPIANTETLSSMHVIVIVAGLVILGLLGQYILHHINKNALKQIWQTTPAE